MGLKPKCNCGDCWACRKNAQARRKYFRLRTGDERLPGHETALAAKVERIKARWGAEVPIPRQSAEEIAKHVAALGLNPEYYRQPAPFGVVRFDREARVFGGKGRME